MNDERKIQLFDELLVCVIQSSHAMDAAARAYAQDPLQAARVILLNKSLDSTKVLLSKVLLRPSSNKRSPLLSIVWESRGVRSLLELPRKR